MLSRFTLLRRKDFVCSLKRNIGFTAPCLQKAAAALDPIQKLFIDKIHDYSNKSKAAGGKLVDMSPETEKNLHDELEKLSKQYGEKGSDFTKFPTFSFSDPTLEPVGIQADPKRFEELIKAAYPEVAEKEDDEKPFYEI